MSGLSSGNWLADGFLAVTLLIALVLLLRGPVARQFGPRLAYALWTIPAARALMPQITLTVDAPPPVAGDLVVLNTASAVPDALAIPTAFDATALLLTAWATGALLLALWSIASYARLRRAIDADASLLDMRGRIAILSSGAVDGPVALGLWRPQVVLPRDFANRFTADQQAYVIAHELAHHRGGDLIANIAAFALLCVNWFNPLAWLGWRAFRSDQEAACDARVLASGTVARADYGRAIVHAVTGTAFHPAHAFALPMASRSALVHRLRSLAMPAISPRRVHIGRAAIAAAALLALPLTASVVYAVEQQDAPPAVPAAPAAPTPITIEAAQNVDISNNGGQHITRVVRDGQTITLLSDRALDQAEVERMLANAQVDRAIAERARGSAEQAAVADGQAEVRRIIIRRVNGGQSADAGNAMPAPPVPPANDEQRREHVYVVGGPNARVYGTPGAHCGAGSPQQTSERVVGEGGERHTVRVVTCGGDAPALRLSALRIARASLAAMSAEQLPAQARTSALAEIDRSIAELEQAPAAE